jgi:squalene synthase HpnC
MRLAFRITGRHYAVMSARPQHVPTSVGTAPPSSGKTARDENFPVASLLLAPEQRPFLLAFYAFARAADDVADAPHLTPAEKLAWLSQMEAALDTDDAATPAGRLGSLMRTAQLDTRHARHLLQAFRQDATKTRYRNWSDLLLYCRFSAAPVGRFVLDVHGAPPSLWPLADALCISLQIINHVQDCRDDFIRLNRVYLPEDWMQAAGATPETLAETRCPAALRQVLDKTLAGVQDLLVTSSPLPRLAPGWRLQRELSVIQQSAVRLTRKLARRDPLSRAVKLSKFEQTLILMRALLRP